MARASNKPIEEIQSWIQCFLSHGGDGDEVPFGSPGHGGVYVGHYKGVKGIRRTGMAAV